jgi:hypothetical protein
LRRHPWPTLRARGEPDAVDARGRPLYELHALLAPVGRLRHRAHVA